MGIRRRSRELAMQALFYMESQNNLSQEMLKRFCDNFRPAQKARPFFFTLVTGVLDTRPEIDAIIQRYATNWRMSRMSGVDRNVMRIAVYEMLNCSDIPPKVSINEAIDVGKKFGTDESGAFINGIMDRIRLALEKNEIEKVKG
jgi:N utilization substance protein B